MKKSGYSETQITKMLKEVEGDRTARAVCREYGIAEGTYCTWKSNYGVAWKWLISSGETF